MESQIMLAWVRQLQDCKMHAAEIESLITIVLTNHQMHGALGTKDYFQFYWYTFLTLKRQNHPLCSTWLEAPYAELQTRVNQLRPNEREAFWQNIVVHKNIQTAVLATKSSSNTTKKNSSCA